MTLSKHVQMSLLMKGLKPQHGDIQDHISLNKSN